MIPSHIDSKEAKSFLSCWLELRKSQSRIYPDFDWLLISAVILEADMARRPPYDAAGIAAAIRMPKATVDSHLKDMEAARYVRRSGDGWAPEEAAWFALEMFLPAFRQILQGLDIKTSKQT